MYLANLEIEGYRLFNENFILKFEKGLTILVGENGSGKSAIVDALRLILLEDEYGRSGILSSDFHRQITDPAISNGIKQIRLKCSFNELNHKEQVAYLPWLNITDISQAFLSLNVDNKEDQRGRYKRSIWGGVSASAIFEWDLLNSINCVYLPPLRDAVSHLRAYRGSRLARLLKNMSKRDLVEDGSAHPLEQKVKLFNNGLVKDDPTITRANRFIKENVVNAIGQVFGQDTTIQFSEARFDRIVEGLRLLFYPRLPGNNQTTPQELFRELDENSLGFNNILYLATILAEFEELDANNTFLKILLIEEPEAHLHPQLLTKLIQYLQEKAKVDGIQIIVTTHSPVITASVSLDSIKVITVPSPTISPVVTSIADCGLNPDSKFFIERWLDVTKSTLFFAKGIILVEGIAEALVIPELARRVIENYNLENDCQNAPSTLKEYGVSVINLNGIYFDHFMQLFVGYRYDNNRKKKPSAKIPIRCAGITDCDPEKQSKPIPKQPCECKNRLFFMVQDLVNHENCRLFTNLKTFEYDFALEGNNLQLMSEVYLEMLDTDGTNKKKALEMNKTDWSRSDVGEIHKASEAFWLLTQISSHKGEFSQLLAYKLSQDSNMVVSVPLYIKDAVLWATGKI